MYKLVVLDVDDTLVTTVAGVSPAVKTAITKAQNAGIYVTLASGRMHQSMQSVAQELEIKLPLISCNGAMVRDEKDVVSCEVLDKGLAKEIIAFFNNKDRVLQMYTKDGLYTKEKCARTWRLELSEGLPCNIIDAERYENFYQEELLKFLIRLEPEEVESYREEVATHFGKNISAALSHQVYLEMTNQGVNKAKGVATLAQSLGVKQSEVLAIGDSPNDKDMLEWAGLGIAMGNAMPEVKAVADLITGTIEQDGVARALDQYLF